MEAWRNAVRQVDRGDRRRFEGSRVEDREIGRIGLRVDDEADKPAVILIGRVRKRAVVIAKDSPAHV